MRAQDLFEYTTHKGVKITFDHRPAAEHLKAGYICDQIDAYEEGKKVGYLKIDRIDISLFKKECPDIWAYMQEYMGKHMFSDPTQPIGEKPLSELVSAIRSGYISRYVHYYAKQMKWAPEEISTINTIANGDSIPDYSKYESIIRKFFKQWNKTDSGKDAITRMKATIDRATKPFVAYINTKENSHQGVEANNSGRGIGMALYLEGARWIAKRGLAKGLYASSLQSDEAKEAWIKLERQGLVVQDGKRKYVKG